MLIMLGLLFFIVVLFCFPIFVEMELLAPAIGLTFLIAIFGFLVPLTESYSSYIDMKQIYDVTISQYRNSVEMYEDKAVINVNRESFTDFKYKGYQKQIGTMISDLRDKVEEYNNLYIGKEAKSDNIFFSWYIIEPSKDMKLIRLKCGGGLQVRR